MLTKSQLELHWNSCHGTGWGSVCHVNHWRMTDGRLSPQARGPQTSDWHKAVWAYAQMLAGQSGREVTPDHLRKGAYIYAFGKSKSLTAFDNDELDRTLNVFALLINPVNLEAVTERLAYENYDRAMRSRAERKRLGIESDERLPDHPGERKRHLWFARSVNADYLRAILRDRFHGRRPEDLSLGQLRELTRTLKNRPHANRPTTRRHPAFSAANAPF